MKILIVEDDEYLAEALQECLIQQHYTVDVVADGETGWQYGSTFVYDLILLDVLLPKLDGVSLCQRFRDRGYHTPILLLTGRNSSTDKIKGLDAGADDYLVKPFDFEELTARIRALLRRDNQTLSSILEWDNLCLNSNTYEVTYANELLHLTPKEYALLELLLRNPERVFSPGEIIDRLWSAQEVPGDETVRTHVKELRRKLRIAGASGNLITTIYGQGYCLKSSKEQQKTAKNHENKEPEKKVDSSQDFNPLILVWEQFKEGLIARLEVLEQAANVLLKRSLAPKLQKQAKLAAHTLAGTLGTFGFTQGSEIARVLESMLETEVKPEQGKLFAALLITLRQEMKATPKIEISHLNIEKSPLLLIIDDESEFTEQLAAFAAAYSIRSAIVSTLSQAKLFLTQEFPDIVLIKISFQGSFPLHSLELIDFLVQEKPSLPVLVIADRGLWGDRLAASSRGVYGFLEQPVSPEQVINSVKKALKRSHAGAKIMVVDDDLLLLKALPDILSPWEFKLTTLENPQKFWEVLKDLEPDLLILDIEMPNINGIQICRALRSDPHWNHLPVIFLSVRADSETQNLVFLSGADDYLSKPILGAELANRIVNRLERVKNKKRI
jgi:DNA-binding response OmpR family regulator